MVFVGLPLFSFLVTLLSTLVTKIDHPHVNSVRGYFIAQAAKHFGYLKALVPGDATEDFQGRAVDQMVEGVMPKLPPTSYRKTSVLLDAMEDYQGRAIAQCLRAALQIDVETPTPDAPTLEEITTTLSPISHHKTLILSEAKEDYQGRAIDQCVRAAPLQLNSDTGKLPHDAPNLEEVTTIVPHSYHKTFIPLGASENPQGTKVEQFAVVKLLEASPKKATLDAPILEGVAATLPQTNGMIALPGYCACQDITHQEHAGVLGDFFRALHRFGLFFESHFHLDLVLLKYRVFIKEWWKVVREAVGYMGGLMPTMGEAAEFLLITIFAIHLGLFLGSRASHINNVSTNEKSSPSNAINDTSTKPTDPDVSLRTPTLSSITSATSVAPPANNNADQMEEASSAHSIGEHAVSSLADVLDPFQTSESTSLSTGTGERESDTVRMLAWTPITDDVPCPHETVPSQQASSDALELYDDNTPPNSGEGGGEPSYDRDIDPTCDSAGPKSASPQFEPQDSTPHLDLPTAVQHNASPESASTQPEPQDSTPPLDLPTVIQDNASPESSYLPIEQWVSPQETRETTESEGRLQPRPSKGIYKCPGRRAADKEGIPLAVLDGNVMEIGGSTGAKEMVVAGSRSTWPSCGDENENREEAFVGVNRRKSRQSLYG